MTQAGAEAALRVLKTIKRVAQSFAFQKLCGCFLNGVWLRATSRRAGRRALRYPAPLLVQRVATALFSCRGLWLRTKSPRHNLRAVATSFNALFEDGHTNEEMMGIHTHRTEDFKVAGQEVVKSMPGTGRPPESGGDFLMDSVTDWLMDKLLSKPPEPKPPDHERPPTHGCPACTRGGGGQNAVQFYEGRSDDPFYALHELLGDFR